MKTSPTPDKKEMDALLRAKLNLETARMEWHELERYFAAGMVIVVADDLDLVDVAVAIANDDKAAVTQWMQEQKVARVSDAQATTWSERKAALWAVVVKPWILVQPEKTH